MRNRSSRYIFYPSDTIIPHSGQQNALSESVLRTVWNLSSIAVGNAFHSEISTHFDDVICCPECGFFVGSLRTRGGCKAWATLVVSVSIARAWRSTPSSLHHIFTTWRSPSFLAAYTLSGVSLHVLFFIPVAPLSFVAFAICFVCFLFLSSPSCSSSRATSSEHSRVYSRFVYRVNNGHS